MKPEVKSYRDNGFEEITGHTNHFSSFKINILSEADVSSGIKDTVYTTNNNWLELRIDQQMLYQHWRDGRVLKYPVSSGNKFLDRSIESRPGLFAIFVKTERHESSQYNNAEMFYFMPFNQGIGFHSLNGTGYYGNLGVRPSSHGCIRMRHEDVKKVFGDSPLGTLVLAHRGYTARTVSFAPDGYENPEEMTKDEMKYYLAENLYNILEGNYYMKERKYFVINPKIIPVSGVYLSYDKNIPAKQNFPKSNYMFLNINDRTLMFRAGEILDSVKSSEFTSADKNIINDDAVVNKSNTVHDLSSAEIIKQYFHNPIGILPYFPPNK
jgi:hypothetical protein